MIGSLPPSPSLSLSPPPNAVAEPEAGGAVAYGTKVGPISVEGLQKLRRSRLSQLRYPITHKLSLQSGQNRRHRLALSPYIITYQLVPTLVPTSTVAYLSVQGRAEAYRGGTRKICTRFTDIPCLAMTALPSPRRALVNIQGAY